MAAGGTEGNVGGAEGGGGGGSSLPQLDADMACLCPAVHRPRMEDKSCLLNFWEPVSLAF